MAVDPQEHVPAQDLASERSILGALLLDPQCIPRALPLVRPGHFYRSGHGKLFSAIVAVHKRGDVPDLVSVVNELRTRGLVEAAGGPQYIAGLLEATGSVANLAYYARQVRTAWACRQRVRIGLELANGTSADPEAAAALLGDLEAIRAEEAGPGAPLWAPAILSGVEWDAEPMPVPPSLIGDGILCAAELGVLFAATETGKSYLGEQICRAVATGEPWFGMPTIPGGVPVLDIHLELTAPRLKERRARQFSSTPANLHTLTFDRLGEQIDILTKAHQDALCEAAITVGAKLVYIDPLQELHSSGETNDSFHDIVRALSACMIRTGAAFLVAHHEPKAPNESKETVRSDIDMLRGGGRLAGAVKLAMRLVRMKAPNRFELRFAKVTYREHPEPLYLKHGEHGFFELAEAPEEARDRVADAIERVLLGAGVGGNTSTARLRDACKSAGVASSEDSVRRALDRLAHRWGLADRNDLRIGDRKMSGWTYRTAASEGDHSDPPCDPSLSEEW